MKKETYREMILSVPDGGQRVIKNKRVKSRGLIQEAVRINREERLKGVITDEQIMYSVSIKDNIIITNQIKEK